MLGVPLLVCALSLAGGGGAVHDAGGVVGAVNDVHAGGGAAIVVKSGVGASTAVVTLAADATRVFDTVADPSTWPTVFSDAERVERDKNGVDWRVRSRMLGGSMLLELTRVRRPRAVDFEITDALGAAGHVELRLEPVARGATKVTYTLTTTLPLGLDGVVDDALVRKHREHKILTDLFDLERRFGASQQAR